MSARVPLLRDRGRFSLFPRGTFSLFLSLSPLSLSLCLSDVCCHCEQAHVISRNARTRARQINMQILSQFGAHGSSGIRPRRNIYPAIFPMSLTTRDFIIFLPLPYSPVCFHILFFALFAQLFFVLFCARAART